MEIELGLIDLIKLCVKFIGHKILQYRLTTSETLIVHTTHGKVKGVKRLTIYDQPYYSFEGIPFAEPPLGDLRFKAPQPLKPWNGVRDCMKPCNKPLQRNFFTGMKEGSEDCLYLNVYTKLESDKLLPVMVWIYGGGFQVGEASRDVYGPDYFMEKDVVLIEITYRLGALGFLSLSDPHLNVPGNAGLKDQLMALRWIKQNCLYFNGDPNNITLFGESAGAASTQYLMLTPKAESLFHKSIMMSGSVLCPWANQSINDRGWGYRLANYLGYIGEEEDKSVFEFLSKVSADRLVGIDECLKTNEEIANLVLFPFAPTIEPYISESCVVPKSPKEMMQDAWSNDIPLLIGGTSFEGLFLYKNVKKNFSLIIGNTNNCTNLVPLELNLPRESQKSKQIAHTLYQEHFDGSDPKDRFIKTLELLSLKIIWHGLHRTLLSRANYSNAPTYLYRFDYDSPEFNQCRILQCGKGVRGVSHGDDLSYLYHTIMSWKLENDSSEYLTIQRMIDIFTTFAATSDPNCKSTVPVTWTPVEKYSSEKPFKCLNIGNCCELIDLPEHSKLTVWDSIYPQEDLY